jgi:hypothetical protein
VSGDAVSSELERMLKRSKTREWILAAAPREKERNVASRTGDRQAQLKEA